MAHVVPTGALPLLAPPRGDAPRIYRKRHNTLNESQEEALRAQVRQHMGAAPSAAAYAVGGRDSSMSSADPLDGAAGSASETGDEREQWGGSGHRWSALWPRPASEAAAGGLLALRRALHRALRLADADMAEEIDVGDPRIQAGKQFLAGVEEFAALSEHELAQLVRVSELRCYDAGEVVLADERAADGLYVVLSGAAGRFPATDGSLDAVAPTDEFGYQEHFGVSVAGDEREPQTEAAVLATSDALECVWLPELVVRMLNLRPRMDYEFVLVLHNARGGEAQDAQEKLVLGLLRAGLHVTVLANTRNTAQSVVLLLSAPLWLLAREDKLMTMERIIEHHAEEDTRSVGDDYEYHGETMTPSDRIAAFASILTRSAADKPPGAGLRGVEHNQDAVVRDVFPLHDPSITDFILTAWTRGEGEHSATYRRLFLLRLKDYFGLRVAFYMAFVRLYNAALVYPSNAGILLWVFVRWVDYRWYLKALGVYGLCVAFVWAPAFLRRWGRYQNSLLAEWNLLGTKEVAQPNPEFRDYVVETINVAAEGEPPDYVEVKTFDARRRWPKYAFFAVFCFLCLVLLFLLVGVYVQWYIIAVMTPMCTDPRCPEFMDAKGGGGCESHCAELFGRGKTYLFMKAISSCAEYCDPRAFDRSYYRCDAALIGCFETERGIVGTARWFYVLVQGIVLGLTLDIVFLAIFEAIALAFNRWENYQTEQERETRCIQKIFLFNWVGYFYWFFLLAFVYVPNGADVQDAIRTRVDNNWVFTLNYNFRFSRYWVDGLISMDSAFVTPMIVTQALNLLINTFVPFLLRRAIIRARDSYHVRKEKLSTALKKGIKAAAAAGQSDAAARDTDSFTSRSVEASDADDTGAGAAAAIAFSDVDQWVALSDGVDRRELGRALAEREPVGARQLDGAVRELFSSISSHEHHMSEICGDLAREDLDPFQMTSYDWVDRITRSIEDSGALRGFWDTATASMGHERGSGGSGNSNSGSDGDGGGGHTGALKLRLVTHWQCRNYRYTADRVMEESSMGTYSPFGDLLHLAIQFSYTIMFSVVWPFCCFCSFARNTVALRFDAIKMAIDCKRPVPRRTVGIGPWFHALVFEILVAQAVVPALFVYVSGQLDAFFDECRISEARYGPGTCLSAAQRLAAFCSLENVGVAVCFLVYYMKNDISDETALKVVAHTRKLRHNLRKSVRMIGESILVSSGASPPSAASLSGVAVAPAPAPTAGYLAAASAMRHPQRPDADARVLNGNDQGREGDEEDDAEDPNVLFSVDLDLGMSSSAGSGGTTAARDGGRDLRRRRPTVAVTGSQPSARALLNQAPEASKVVEWREGTVSWVKNGRIKVNFSAGRKLGDAPSPNVGGGGGDETEAEVWLTSSERHVLMDPTPVKIFEVGMPVLLASRKFGRWLEASVTAVDARDRLGNAVRPQPNEMHLRIAEAQNLRAARGGAVDPYCVVTVQSAPASAAVFRHATSIKRRAANPVWDEQLIVPLHASELFGENSALGGSAAASVPGGAVLGNPTTATTATATVKVVVYNNDPFARLERLGEAEMDLRDLRDGRRHRVLLPLALGKRYVWTLEAIQRLQHRQTLGGEDYPLLGTPHVLLELQWIDTRLPTKVAVRVKGQRGELVLSRKFCESHLCYGIRPETVASQPKFQFS